MGLSAKAVMKDRVCCFLREEGAQVIRQPEELRYVVYSLGGWKCIFGPYVSLGDEVFLESRQTYFQVGNLIFIFFQLVPTSSREGMCVSPGERESGPGILETRILTASQPL
jgi:hypothetical protein